MQNSKCKMQKDGTTESPHRRSRSRSLVPLPSAPPTGEGDAQKCPKSVPFCVSTSAHSLPEGRKKAETRHSKLKIQNSKLAVFPSPLPSLIFLANSTLR